MHAKLVCIATVLLVVCVSIMGTATANMDDYDEKVLYVSGIGKVTASPDRAMVSLAVETENDNVKNAQHENAARMNAIINAIKTLGLTSDDLKTTGYNIISLREVSSNILDRDKPFYRVTNTLLVTVKDIEKVGEIIDIAIESGSNRVNFISFTLSDEKQLELRSQALSAAVQQARRDADAVADALEMSVKDVKEVNVAGSYIPVRYSGDFQKEDVIPFEVPTPIEPDTVDVTATVSITYIIG